MSIRSKVRTGRYGLALVAVTSGIAFAAMQGATVTPFGKLYPDTDTAQREAIRKFGREAVIVQPNKPDLTTLTVADLRERAKAKGIKGYGKLPKAKLIEALA